MNNLGPFLSILFRCFEDVTCKQVATLLHFCPLQREEEHSTASRYAAVTPTAEHAPHDQSKCPSDEAGNGNAALGDQGRGKEDMRSSKLPPQCGKVDIDIVVLVSQVFFILKVIDPCMSWLVCRLIQLPVLS